MSNAVERWFSTKNLSPLKEFSEIEESFDQLMSQMMTFRKQNFQNSFSPSCDITEDSGHYILKFDMPGVSKDHLKVEIHGNQLSVRAEREEQKQNDNNKKFLSEIFYGSYARNFTLPSALDEKEVEARFENGVLTITVPKSKKNTT